MGLRELIFTVGKDENGMLLREFLDKKGLSKTLVKKAKGKGLFVSGELVTVRRVLSMGEEVKVSVLEVGSEGISPVCIPLTVVYEDEFILVVDKPRNMPTHPSRGNSLPTLANAVMALMGEGFVFRAISRLDRDTSGLVLIAKDSVSANTLSASMRKRKIIKKYLALAQGTFENHHGFINAPIKRESEDSVKRIVSEDGKDALTEYEVMETKDGNTLLEVTLHTGRTHQIRVHLAHIGHPLVGDFLYGKNSEDGYYLRCHNLIFPHPITGDIIEIKV